MSDADDRAHLQDLLDLEEGLTAWEVEFLDSLSKWPQEFTPKQSKLLYQIYERRM